VPVALHAVNRFIDDHNAAPKPFVWTASPEMILDKVARGASSLSLGALAARLAEAHAA
jgi:hypothetical protein